ncbi:unnamed protein product [Prorocentrum cordatum]|uniref:Uncharacterized protein n=1 Tax=Prorocentrum cordatum TaxID=2364126 RepID=A0ABN9XQ40_9DINO|nr:unnamed protein product [Polarella glacialis]
MAAGPRTRVLHAYRNKDVALPFQAGLIYLGSDSGQVQWQCGASWTGWHGEFKLNADQMMVAFEMRAPRTTVSGSRVGPAAHQHCGGRRAGWHRGSFSPRPCLLLDLFDRRRVWASELRRRPCVCEGVSSGGSAAAAMS